MGGQQMVSILDNFQYSLKVTYRKNAIWLFSIIITIISKYYNN